MSMIDVIRKEMMTAMKNKDKERKESLSMLLSALKNAQIDKREDLTEAEENTIIDKKRSNRQKRQWILALLIVQISLMNAKQD